MYTEDSFKRPIGYWYTSAFTIYINYSIKSISLNWIADIEYPSPRVNHLLLNYTRQKHFRQFPTGDVPKIPLICTVRWTVNYIVGISSSSKTWTKFNNLSLLSRPVLMLYEGPPLEMGGLFACSWATCLWWRVTLLTGVGDVTRVWEVVCR